MVAEGAAHDALVGPAHPVGDDGGAVRPAIGDQRPGHIREVVDGEVDGERPAACGEPLQLFVVWHGGRAHGSPRQNHGLGDARKGKLLLERRRCRRVGRHAGGHVVSDAEAVEAAHLLGNRTVERGIAGMEPRDLVAVCRRLLHLGYDGVEIERRGVDDARTRRCFLQDHGRHQRARVEHHLATAQQSEPPHRDQVRRAGTCADEVDRHALSAARGVSAASPNP